ncbi:MAG: hypothetical protein IKM00_04730, partial [Clostridia bacterium]|nr:hypothetical protein [Clostridia bacterium]
MRKEQLADAITGLDADILDQYFIMKRNLEKKRRKKRILIRWGSIAACLTVVFTISWMIAWQRKPSESTPVSIRYASLEEAHKA